MFGLGFAEILVILVVALIFLGPERLPEAARLLGKTLGELRRAVDEIRFDLTTSDYRSAPPTNPPSSASQSSASQTPRQAALTASALNSELEEPPVAQTETGGTQLESSDLDLAVSEKSEN